MSENYRLGEWLVEPDLNRLSRDAHSCHLEPRAMDVLVHLLVHQHRVISVDELLEKLWPDRHGDPGMVKKRIAQVRSALEDDARHPRYIENIPKRGYRVIASVSRAPEPIARTSVPPRETPDGSVAIAPTRGSTPQPLAANRRLRGYLVIASALLIVAATAGIWTPGSIWPQSGKSEDAAAPLSAIAVMPFDDLSPDADHGWLANGIAEDLIEALGRIDALFVPVRHSAELLKIQGADLPTIGKRLAVGSVVQGSVRRVGDQLNVVARWVRIEDGAQLWSARFDRRFDDVLVIQHEIAIGIAEAVRTELGIEDAPAWLLSRRYTPSDVRAWRLVKTASPLIDTMEPANIVRARKMLVRATEYDPDFAFAQALLGFIEYFDDVQAGIEQVKRALQLDPTNPGALSLLAWDSAMRFWDYETARQLLQRVPSARATPGTWDVQWHVFSTLGLLDKALWAAEQAVRRDPMAAKSYCFLGHARMWQGDQASAIAAYRQAIAVERETRQFGTHCAGTLARLYLQSERKAEALTLLLNAQQFRAFDPELIRSRWASGGWEGVNLAVADAYSAHPSRELGWSCHYPALGAAGAVERMYSCLETEMEQTGLDVPVQTYAQTLRRVTLAFHLANPLSPYHDEPRFRALHRRSEERIRRAAGTYAGKVGLQMIQQASPGE